MVWGEEQSFFRFQGVLSLRAVSAFLSSFADLHVGDSISA